jgi:hypothetical protein
MEKTRAMFARHGGEEYYALVAAADPQAAALSTDLFDGCAG